jgi:plastocyanin
MEMKTPEFRGARSATGRAARTAMALMALAIPLAVSIAADGAPPTAAGVITVKGKTTGSNKLLNPVWNEAKDPKLHQFTFREPSATVRPDVRTLTAFLPKELCIAALVPGDGKALSVPYRIVVAGGRTSPVTLVVAPGQQLQFENQDPFAHKLYVVGADAKGFQPIETGPSKNRTWTPPGPGKYEIRDQFAPSVRSWIVVEPHVVSIGYPDRKGDFQIDLQAGAYTLRGFFNGEPVGAELPVNVAPGPVEQPLKAPLVVGEADAPATPAASASGTPGAAGAGKPPGKKGANGGGGN